MPPPVLLIAFNRPDLVANQLQQIAKCGVRDLYVSIDGPRVHNGPDRERCEFVREVVINHPCIAPKEILQHETNLGCAKAPPTAISWFLDKVGEGIILEDDCFPEPSFFSFCEFMLKAYRKEERIFSVAGSNWFPPEIDLPMTHFFSMHPNVWGWATWNRAWKHYKSDLSQKSLEEWKRLIVGRFSSVIEQRFWKEILTSYLKKQLNTWDYAFVFSSWCHDALHIVSSKNLISNHGFRDDATHTDQVSSLAAKMLQSNPGPYSEIAIKRSEFLDRIIFSERFHETSSWANGLFQEGVVSKLESELEEMRVLLMQKDSEIASYYGLSGALKALYRRFCAPS